MQCNLAVVILNHMLYEASFSDSGGVALSEFRSRHSIPSTTFYRHIRTLIQNRIIARTSRDRYILHHQFIEHVESFALVQGDAEYMRDYKMPLRFNDDD